MFVSGKIVYVASKAKAYPSEAILRCSTLGYATVLHPQTLDEAKKPAMDKHSNLLRMLVIYQSKTFCNIGISY